MEQPFEFDVFISYTSADQRWAKNLAEMLRRHRLRVFLSLDHCDPGEPFDPTIERAIAATRNFVVLLSRNSLKRAGVKREIVLARESRIQTGCPEVIPIALESLRKLQLAPDWNGVSIVDLGRANTRRIEVNNLLRRLNVLTTATLTNIEIDSLAPRLIEGDAGDIAVGGIDDVERWGWDPGGVELLKRLIDLDQTTFGFSDGPATEEFEGTPEQWGPVFMSQPDTWRLLIDESDSIIGYWHFVAIDDAMWERASNGHLMDSELTVESIVDMLEPGEYSIYFTMVALKNFRRQRHVERQMLLTSLLKTIVDLSESGIFVSRIITNACTDAGKLLCSRRFTKGAPHVYAGTMYTGTLQDLLSRSSELQEEFNVLVDNYRQRGLWTA